MSVRVVWVLSLAKVQETGGCLLFCRRFPTVEKRLQVALGDSYTPLPNDQDIATALYTELGLTDKVFQFVDTRDSCDKIEQKPVFEVTTKRGSVWPLLAVEQHGLLFCCLPYVETTGQTKPPLVTIPSISVCFALLSAIADFIGMSSNTSEYVQKSSKFSDLHHFLGEAAPFGTVRDAVVSSIRTKLNIKPQAVAANTSHVQPSWKPELYKGKSQLSFTIAEKIRAVQYNNIDKPDVFTLFGSVTCKADVEGIMPDVTINLAHNPTSGTPLDHLQTHACVMRADTYIIDEDAAKSSKAGPRKMRFSPPTVPFTLCHYRTAPPHKLPITGAYHMKMDGQVANLDVKLYLSADVKNAFDYCELHLPFYNRGVIDTHDSTCTTGNVSLSQDRRVLMWNIGQKFPSKSPEIVLASSVTFVKPRHVPANQYEDPFCVDNNAYAQVCFKINNFTLSGCYIDPKSVQTSPVSKVKLTTANTLTSTDYKIWNSYGAVLSA